MDWTKYFYLDRFTWSLFWKERVESDFPRKGEFKRWNSRYAGKLAGNTVKGYHRVRINSRFYQAHRVIYEMVIGPVPDGFVVDHINGITTDNRIENLRAVTREDNMKNMKMYKSNKTGVVGVFFCKRQKQFCASISLLGRAKFLGYFDSLEDAAVVRRRAEEEHYGEYRRMK